MSKKFLAKLLIFCMVFTMLPVSAFGATADETTAKTSSPYSIIADTSALVTIKLDEIPNNSVTLSAELTSPDETVYVIGEDAVPVWTSSKEDVATVENGVVKGLKVGATQVTVTYPARYGNVSATWNVEVIAAGTHAVTVDGTIIRGHVTADVTTAAKGDTVTLTVTPDTGYKLQANSLTVTPTPTAGTGAGGTSTGIAVTQTGVNTYTFVMPDYDVTVNAVFEAETPAVGGGYTLKVNSDITRLTGSTKTATLNAVIWLGEKEQVELSEIDGAKLAWTVEPEEVVTLSGSGKQVTATAKEVEEATEVVVTATVSVPETKKVEDKDGNVTVEVVKDEKGNTVMKELTTGSCVLTVDPVTYTIAMKETSAVELFVNGTTEERFKSMAVVVKADDKEVTGLPIVWSSSDDTIAKVYNGQVEGKGYGSATITATIEGTAVKATRTVNVAYKPVNVTFNAGEGKFAEEGEVKAKTNAQGKLTAFPAEPTREGYLFMGWVVGSENEPVTLDKVYAEDITLNTLWVEIKPLEAEVGTTDAAGKQEASISGTFNAAVSKDENVAEGSEDAIPAATASKVTFDVTTRGGNTANTKEVKVNIAAETAATLKNTNTVEIITNVATVTLSGEALQDLAAAGYKAGSNNVVLTAEKKENSIVENTALKEKIKATFDFALKLGADSVINSANAKISVSFKAPEGITNSVNAYFVKTPTELVPVTASVKNGIVTLTTGHFSEYVVSADKLVYTITFKPGEAAGTEYVQNVQITPNDKDGNKVPTKVRLLANKFSKAGATFANWTPGNYKNEQEIEVSDDMTLTAVWKDDTTGNVISSGSNGGGGSSSNVSVATKVTGGKVSMTPTRPTKGQTVTINVTPADGYKLDSLTVTDLKGNVIELTKVSDSKYTFVMPAGKVKVTPVFSKIDGSDKKDDTTNVSKRFSDVDSSAWYAEYINYVAENGLMNGYEDGRFGPNDKTTRAQIVTVLFRMEGEPAVSSSANFKDVSAGGQYYSAAVAWAARNNIVNGYEDGRFGPNDNVTREQIAAILFRYAEYKGYDTSLTGNVAGFSDGAKVSSWADKAIGWAIGEGLMNGDNGALRPQGNATRAEIAALLMRFAENIAK